jgi:virB6 protein
MNPMSFLDIRKHLQTGADVTLYSSIRNYLAARIEYFMESTLSHNISLALTIVGTLFTFWIMVQGYLILTGRSQESLKTFVFNIGKTYIIILFALGVSSTSEFAVRELTDVTTDGVASLMMDKDIDISKCTIKASSSVLGCQIDKNLLTAQALMAFINQVDTANDVHSAGQVERAKLFAGAGAAGPAIVTGTMLILYRVAMALFIGFSPFFILCLMFKKTTPYFTKWLNYGLATIFSSVLLAAMAAICTDLVELIAKRQFASAAPLSAFGLNSVGIFSSSMNQLGLGLMLSTVLIIVPPMAGNWFNGVMGGYFAANYMDRWNNPNGQNTVGTGQGSGSHGMPAYGNQQQSVNYQNNAVQPHSQSDDATRRITRDIAINSGQASNPTTSPANSLVGAGNRTRQSEPNNNGGNTNGQA